MPGQSLYKVADLSVVWVEADVYESELAARPRGRCGDRDRGRLSRRAVHRPRHLHLSVPRREDAHEQSPRASWPNRGGRLKPGMFANVELTSRGRSGLVVPTERRARLRDRTTRLRRARATGCFSHARSRSGVASATPRRFSTASRKASRWRPARPSSSIPRVSFARRFRVMSLHGADWGRRACRQIDITFRTVPDPPQTGDNQLEADGQGRERQADRRRGGDRAVLHARDADDEHAGDEERGELSRSRRRRLSRERASDDGRPVGCHRDRHAGRAAPRNASSCRWSRSDRTHHRLVCGQSVPGVHGHRDPHGVGHLGDDARRRSTPCRTSPTCR